MDCDQIALALDPNHLGSQVKDHANFAKYALHLLADGGIHGGEDGIRKLHHGHLRTEALVHAAELKANNAAANNDHALGHLRQAQGLGGADDALAVELGKGELNRNRTSGHYDMLGLDQKLFAARDLDGMGIHKRPQTLEYGDLVLSHQKINARAGRVDDLLLARHHLGPIDFRGLDVDSVLGERVHRVVVVLRRVEQRFRRNASDVEAGSA